MVKHHNVHSHAKVESNCTFVELQITSASGDQYQYLSWWTVSCILPVQSRFFFQLTGYISTSPEADTTTQLFQPCLAVWEVQSGIMMAVSSVQQLVCSLNAAVEPVRYKYTLPLNIDVRETIASTKEHCYDQHCLEKSTVCIYISTHQCMTKCCCFGSVVTQVIALTQSYKEEESSTHEWVNTASVDGNGIYYQACYFVSSTPLISISYCIGIFVDLNANRYLPYTHVTEVLLQHSTWTKRQFLSQACVMHLAIPSHLPHLSVGAAA